VLSPGYLYIDYDTSRHRHAVDRYLDRTEIFSQ
jgi:hypothetical protein